MYAFYTWSRSTGSRRIVMKKVVKDAEVIARETAEKVAAEVKDAPQTVKKATAKVAKAAAATVKEVAEKAEEKTDAVKAEVKKAAAKKAPAKKAVVKESVYLQYLGKEISQADLMKQVKEIWTKQMKNKAADLKSIALYLKPEENMVYYVINDDVTGSIAL